MNKWFKALFTIVVIPLLTLLTGCKSDRSISESTIKESAIKLERIVIVAAPITTLGVSELTLAKGNKQPFEAVGYYSDGSSRPLTDLSIGDWFVDNQDVGRFAEPGLFTANDVGRTTLTATKDGITSNTVTVNVSAAVITAIQVTPALVNVAKGQTEPLVATATYSDGTSAQVTNSVVWASVDTNIATVAPSGLLSGVDVGSTTVTATKDGITSNTVTLNVSAAVITAIQVTPSPVNITKGQTEQLVATATYSDGTSAQVTDSVKWGVGNANITTVTPSGLLSGVRVGNTMLTAMKDGITSNTVTVNVSAAVITAIQVTPALVNIAKGQTEPLVATATYSDGTSAQVTNSVAWTSVDTNTATVAPSGLLSGVDVGTTTVTAMKDGITSNTVTVNVSAAVITAIQVTPALVNIAKGQTEPLVATATYSDGTSAQVTNSVAWTSVDTNTATVAPSGLLSGVELGTTTVTAMKDGITSNTVTVNVSAAVITAIQVTPSPVNIAKGQTEPLVATATYSDGTSAQVTNSVAWTPVDTNTATVAPSGLLSGVNVGTTTVTAMKDGITSNTVTVNVSAAVITAIQVTPSPMNVAKGQTEQLVATATYSDGTSAQVTNSVAWTSVDTNTATVAPSGLLSGVDVGTTTVTAMKDGITSNTVTVNVSAAVITAIQVTPSPVNIVKGQTEPLVATATYSDGTSAQVTNSVAWTSVDTNTATVAPSGLLSGVEVGTTTVTAMKDGITSNTVTVNVSAAVITAIQVTPSPVNIAKGQTEPLVATATYSDGTSAQVTNSVAWTSVDTNTATVAPSGLLSGVDVGRTTVTAMKDGITSNTVTVNVSAAVITAIQVTPSPMNVAKGQIEQLVATATYSDGTSAQVSNSVAWTTVDTNTATVAPSGLLSGVEVGTTTVTAMKDGITSNRVSVNVSAAVITAIQVTTPSVDVAKGLDQPLVAIATYSDGTSAQVTNSAGWISVDNHTATVTSSGMLSGVDVGRTTVTAMKDGITSNTVNVNVCADLSGACIDIIKAGKGKLFTSSPSVPYLDSIGGSPVYTSILEPGKAGLKGYFYIFGEQHAKALCDTYNTKRIGGRNNWRLPTRDELKVDLYDVRGSMVLRRGWPASAYYRVTEPDVVFNVDYGASYNMNPQTIGSIYTSCVSEP